MSQWTLTNNKVPSKYNSYLDEQEQSGYLTDKIESVSNVERFMYHMGTINWLSL